MKYYEEFTITEMIELGEEHFAVTLPSSKKQSLNKKVRRFFKKNEISQVGKKQVGKTVADTYSYEDARRVIFIEFENDFLAYRFSSKEEFSAYAEKAKKLNQDRMLELRQPSLNKQRPNNLTIDEKERIELQITNTFHRRKYEIMLESIFSGLGYSLDEDKLFADIKTKIEFEQPEVDDINALYLKANSDYMNFKNYVNKG